MTELLRLVEELRERESRLKTELLEHKLLKETVAIVPVLENEISNKQTEIETNSKKIETLEAENDRLKNELQELKADIERERIENEKKSKALEEEIAELKKTISDHNSNGVESIESDELSSSQRFQGLVEVSVKSNLIKNLKKASNKCAENSLNQDGNLKLLETSADLKRELVENEKPRHSRCNSEELNDSTTESVLANVRSRVARVPKPPPKPSSSSPSSLTSSSEENNGATDQVIP